ncbi:MAG: hypothetical protein EOO74_00930, partial [Myxococcales bacterium]
MRDRLRSLGLESPPFRATCEALLVAVPQRPKAPAAAVSPALRKVLTPFERRAARAPARLALVMPGDASPLEALAIRHRLPLPADARDLYATVAVLESRGEVSLRLVPVDAATVRPADGELPARWHVLTVHDVSDDRDDVLHLCCFLRDGRTHWSFERTHDDFGSMRHHRAATAAEVLSFATASGPRIPGPHAWQSFFLGPGPRSLYVLEVPGLGPRENSILRLHAERRSLLADLAPLAQDHTASDMIRLFARSVDARLAVHVIEDDRRQSVIDLRPLVSAKVGHLPRTPLSGLAALRRKVGDPAFDALLERGGLTMPIPGRSLTAAIPKLTGVRLERGRTLRLQGRAPGLPRVLALGTHDMDEG